MSTRYPIPADTIRTELRVVNSRFITTVGEARTAAAARAFVSRVSEEFADASHNVYAFRAGYGSSITEGMSDDGEPSGTAGRPVLAVLRGADLGDVAMVVTRYFGGTKLGTGGLVRAYTEAARAALADLPRTERFERRRGLITSPYNLYEPIKHLIDECGGQIEAEDFAGNVTIRVIFPVDNVAPLDDALRELSAGRLSAEWNEDTFD